jgi:hypothetical protein
MNARVRPVRPVLRRCDDCGVLVTEDVSPGMHAPHYGTTPEGHTALLNCAGDVLVFEEPPDATPDDIERDGGAR